MSAARVGPVDLDRFERLPNSRNGNPRFRLIAADGRSWRTRADADLNYGVENLWSRAAHGARHRQVLYLDHRGHVENMREAPCQ